MASENVVSAAAEEAAESDPRRRLLIGLGLAATAFVVFQLPLLLNEWLGIYLGDFALTGGFWTFLQVVMLVGGAIVTGSAVVRRPKSAPLLAAAAGIAWLIGNGMDPDWDSARRVMFVLSGVALTAALLVALPFLMGRLFVVVLAGRPAAEVEERGRFVGWVMSRTVVSVLVVLHFVAILSSVLSAPIPGRDSSWLARWVSFEGRPYIEFCYLENSYRFYSPEPGPPTLLWAFVEYSDGSGQWVKLPNREEHTNSQEFTRRLSIGESITHSFPVAAIPEPIQTKRLQNNLPPLHPELPLLAQYQMPTPECQRNISEYARYLAKHYPADDPRVSIKGVKIYRVLHLMLEPRLMASGKFKPTEPWTYLPYFQGEYNAKGELIDAHDPLLFWLIPIYAWPQGVPLPARFTTTGPLPLEQYDALNVFDYLELHARAQQRPEVH